MAHQNANGVVDSPRRFGTILVARPQTQRPSELEVLLREHCHKMRILSSPTKLSGAHMVFEKGVAIRIYYQYDLERLDQQSDGTDGIFQFCMAFQWPIVFFVTPNPEEAYQSGSFVERVMMQSIVAPVPANKAPPRLCVFSDTKQVLDAFFIFADDVTNSERRAKRSQIMQTLHQSSSNDQGCVATAVRRLLAPPRCPVGEADILLCHFDNLHDIINASDQRLDQLPIERRTKAILREFFGGPMDNPNWRPNTMEEYAEAQNSNNSPTSVTQPDQQYVGVSPYVADPWHGDREPPSLQHPGAAWSHWSEAAPAQSYTPTISSRTYTPIIPSRGLHPTTMAQPHYDPRMIPNRTAGPRIYYS